MILGVNLHWTITLQVIQKLQYDGPLLSKGSKLKTFVLDKILLTDCKTFHML